MIEPLFSDEGERIGIEDVSGVRLAPLPEERAAYAESCRNVYNALSSHASGLSGGERHLDALKASEALERDLPRVLVEHPRLPYDEINAIADAFKVRLTGVNNATRTHARTHAQTPHAIAYEDEPPVVVDAAPEVMLRLRNRGLVDESGVLDVDRLVSDIQNAREEREQAHAAEAGGAPLINLIIATSKNQTSARPASLPAPYAAAEPPAPEEVPKKPRRPPAKPSDLPRRASLPRMDSVKITTGVRVVGEADRATIDRRFQRYLDDIDDRVICMSDSGGYTVGAEYSTRFNDVRRVRYQLERFEHAHDQSLKAAANAVFLTLTTDPNLTDEERAQTVNDTVARIEAKIQRGGLTVPQVNKLRWQIAAARGPDSEIEYLESRLASGHDPGRKLSKRLKALQSDRARAPALIEEYGDPRTAPRRREQVREDLIRMRRLPAAHDAGGFASMWEANRAFQPAWNRFMSYVAKRNGGQRPDYLVSFEFTNSGLLHAHAIIVMDWLASNEEIAREWHRCGQGSVTYIYGLKRTRNRHTNRLEWRWRSAKPQDARSMSGGDYLKKYLKKAMMGKADKHHAAEQARIQSLYWVFNKRFWSCSRGLMDGFESDLAPAKHDPSVPARFSFWRVLSNEVVEEGELVDRVVYHRWRPYDPQRTLESAGGGTLAQEG